MDKIQPRFINIDFEVFTSVIPKYLIREFDRRGQLILYAGKNFYDEGHQFAKSEYLLSIEVNTAANCEQILLEFTKLIQQLSSKAQADWRLIDGLVLDFGYAIPAAQHASSVHIPLFILKQVLALNASFRITTYIEPEEYFDDEDQYSQKMQQAANEIEAELIVSAQETVTLVKQKYGVVFEQLHQILMRADPLGIQEEYEFEASSLLEFLESEEELDTKTLEHLIEIEFHKWSMMPDSDEKREFVTPQIMDLYFNHKALFLRPEADF